MDRSNSKTPDCAGLQLAHAWFKNMGLAKSVLSSYICTYVALMCINLKVTLMNAIRVFLVDTNMQWWMVFRPWLLIGEIQYVTAKGFLPCNYYLTLTVLSISVPYNSGFIVVLYV